MNPRRALLMVVPAYLAACLLALRIESNRLDVPDYSEIEPGLYQGGFVKEPPSGTNAVLNLCEIPDPYQVEVQRHVPIGDTSPAPTLDWLDEQVQFVDQQIRAGHTVYVHCLHGASRSGLVVIAYEMSRKQLTRDQATRFVGSRRGETRPNPEFWELLDQWERKLAKDRVAERSS